MGDVIQINKKADLLQYEHGHSSVLYIRGLDIGGRLEDVCIARPDSDAPVVECDEFTCFQAKKVLRGGDNTAYSHKAARTLPHGLDTAIAEYIHLARQKTEGEELKRAADKVRHYDLDSVFSL